MKARLYKRTYKIHSPLPPCTRYSVTIYTTTTTNVITKTCLFKYTENLTTKKNENFQIKNSDIFHVSAQNIDCGYSLEPPHPAQNIDCGTR